MNETSDGPVASPPLGDATDGRLPTTRFLLPRLSIFVIAPVLPKQASFGSVQSLPPRPDSAT